MPDFIVIPAIDLRNGKCVRLRQGKFSEETVYDTDPVKIALKWEDEGAKYLHVVDLDGAFSGQPINTDLIIKIAAAVKIPVQAGGGLRTEPQIQHLLDNGISRAIIGTTACESEDVISPLIKRFKSSLAIGIDARNGFVQTKGWLTTTSLNAVDLAIRLDQIGVQTLIYTDTGRDGTLSGPNTAAISRFCSKVNCKVIASGGVSKPEDIKKLQKLALANLAGIIVGKALYEGNVSLRKVLAANQ
ncbi:MAG: 1-(5-phosphoribosyl)-5-[(5-phosphoribosylamino)methylideneamino]imidazole-4-carboxamide isomerase [Kiritimatiellia bacterium]|nr:1-(5-phosphoribosyl)-5-[(5-phosphoribosylamino)methylideneamino]imidazole-4-carboxamide isomerase [Kiritimatiellia bacterium]